MKRSLNAMSAFIIWTILVTVLSLMPVDDVNIELFPLQDKMIHFIFYGVMSFLLFHTFTSVSFNNALIVLGVTSLYGIVLEILQAEFVISRYFDYFDIIANIIGSLTGIYIFYLTRKNNHHG